MPERNHACQRCMSWCKSVTDVDRRLLYPMKRTGERGSGEFERISWDEAIDLMAEKLSAAIRKGSPFCELLHLHRQHVHL